MGKQFKPEVVSGLTDVGPGEPSITQIKAIWNGDVTCMKYYQNTDRDERDVGKVPAQRGAV